MIKGNIMNGVILMLEENNVFSYDNFYEFVDWLLRENIIDPELHYPISQLNCNKKGYELEKISVTKENINSVRVDFKYKVGLQEKDRIASVYCRLNDMEVYNFIISNHHKLEIKLLEQAYQYDFCKFFGYNQKIDIKYLTNIVDMLRCKYLSKGQNHYIQVIRQFKEVADILGSKYIPYIKISLITPSYDLKIQLEINEDTLKRCKTKEDLKRAIRFVYRDNSVNLLEYEKGDNLLRDLIDLINKYDFSK
ncbi:hypothetical protein FNU3_34 [Fusobacterium phage vB_FnuS_FNU3]|uniref:Uncharacterized protein n=1 Tax=Fusobacterium phage Fnu1 TaxID=2530024 RepID=A0A481W5R4_9CAUD|nr:hypothetical protein KMD24_gp177 [Fusobacterium phage Fnu1]QBJ04098.1 hypothetical protein [Fusobacterium phage Fnu1]WGH50228.1 hypothetical protein FNU2_103 [Fusobacterium phage vB_FnuS_FNU2]WGH50373.1 hypothetical protein FNU3_34 [Fusobacterium phage vB_FnuS_FNU3]